MSAIYKNSLEHILDELKVINLLLAKRVSDITYLDENNPENIFHGLTISDSKIFKILKKLNETFATEKQTVEQTDLKNIAKLIEEKIKLTEANDIKLPLEEISKRFSLSSFEKKVLLLCLAPEIDSSYETIYAYLQDNITKKRPSYSLLLDVLCTSTEEKMLSRRYFSKTNTLFNFELIHEVNGDSNENILTIDSHIMDFLLGHQKKDSTLEQTTSLVLSESQPVISNSHKTLCERVLKTIISTNQEKEFKKSLVLLGPRGIEKKSLVKYICFSHEDQKPLLIVDVNKVLNSEKDVQKNLLIKIIREAVFQKAHVFLDNLESIFEISEKKTLFFDFLKNLTKSTEFVYIGIENSRNSSLFNNKDTILVEIPNLTYHDRISIWNSYLEQKFSQEFIEDISNKYNLTSYQIESAYTAAKNFAWLENKDSHEISNEHLYKACKLQYDGNLSKLTKKVSSNYNWSDLVLPEKKKKQFQEIIHYIKNKNKVYSDWGFEKKLVSSRGINIMFAGESGTGKTMASSILSNELELDLYKIDLSSLVSKYIGDTEKNLDKIFKEASSSNAVLFFDEADALFGKRSEVSDSHDRYANIEVAYLLQKLEEHDEIVIMSTNMPKNIDSAFSRRMNFWVEFPFPNQTQRFEIWNNVFPKDCPLNLKNEDLEFLAKHFNLSGGNIKNIAVSSAFYAADENIPINIKHLISSIKREYEKTGKSYTRSEFGEFYEMIQK